MFYLKMHFIIGNDQPKEPALCQLYRHTFIPYCAVLLSIRVNSTQKAEYCANARVAYVKLESPHSRSHRPL